MWSLAVEVAFYVVLPLLMLLGVGPGLRVRAGGLLLLGAMVAVSVAWHLGWRSGSTRSRRRCRCPGCPAT